MFEDATLLQATYGVLRMKYGKSVKRKIEAKRQPASWLCVRLLLSVCGYTYDSVYM